MILYFIRHGDPIYNPDSLTTLGHLQADALAKRLSRYNIDEIYTSSSNRAKQTAEPTCKLLHKEMKILDWCNEEHTWNEFAYTDKHGLSWIFQNPEMRKFLVSNEIKKLGYHWYKHPTFSNMNFESGVKRIQKETDAFMASLGYEHNINDHIYTHVHNSPDRVAIFAHQGFGMIFLSCLLDIPYPEFCTHFDLGHSNMTSIEFADNCDEVIPTALQLSNDSHIYSEGLPTNYQNRIYI